MKYYLFLSIFVFCCFSCSDDKENVRIKTLTLTETITNDGGNVNKTDIYLYHNDLLVRHTTTQNFGQGDLVYEVTLNYDRPGQVFSIDSNNNQALYLLNSLSGFAEQCTYTSSGGQIREFTFSYSPDSLLTEITETIDGILGGNIRLAYQSNDIKSSTVMENIINYSAGMYENSQSLPLLALTEAYYPQSLHNEAMFAGLLGKTPKHLIAECHPQGNRDEQTTYSYQFDTQGRPNSITETTTYTGEVVRSITTDRLIRTIHLRYE